MKRLDRRIFSSGAKLLPNQPHRPAAIRCRTKARRAPSPQPMRRLFGGRAESLFRREHARRNKAPRGLSPKPAISRPRQRDVDHWQFPWRGMPRYPRRFFSRAVKVFVVLDRIVAWAFLTPRCAGVKSRSLRLSFFQRRTQAPPDQFTERKAHPPRLLLGGTMQFLG